MESKLSLIIPVFNAEVFILNSLIRLTEWRQSVNYNVQILLVNDGSNDSTELIINGYINTKDNSIELISYKGNQGKGYAVKTGMLTANGKYRVFTDADIPFGFEVIEKILYYLDFKEFDLCIGDRRSKKSKYFIKMNMMRRFSSSIFTLIISRYVVTGVNDTQCGLKGFKADVATKLFSKLQVKGFAFDVEILYLSYKYEFDIKRIPVQFEGNNISTINLTKSSFLMFWNILCLPFRYHLLKKY